MSRESRDVVYVLDILSAARLIQEFAQGIDRQSFEQDSMRQYAVLHGMTLIGEAARRLSNEFRADHPDLPWKNMTGMRNKLVHEYDDVDLDVVWDVVQKDIPQLIRQLVFLVPPDESPPDA